MLPTRSVALRSSIWKRLCLQSYGPNSYITQRNTSLPPTHTVTQYDFLQIPKSDPGWNISVRLPRHFASPFVPLFVSPFSIYRFLFASETTAKGTFLSVSRKAMVRGRKLPTVCCSDCEKRAIMAERSGFLLKKRQRPGIYICHAASGLVSIPNIYVLNSFAM